MSYQVSKQSYVDEIAEIKAAGLWKTERVIVSEQKNDITLEDGAHVVNMCANNYLGLANNTDVKQAASDSLQEWGFGALVPRRYVLFVVPKGFTKRSKGVSVTFWAWKIRSSTRPALTPIRDCSRLFLAPKMR